MKEAERGKQGDLAERRLVLDEKVPWGRKKFVFFTAFCFCAKP